MASAPAPDLSSLSDVSETALVTLFMRAIESRSVNPIITDPEAERIARQLTPLIQASDNPVHQMIAKRQIPRGAIITTVQRVRRFDQYTRDFLRRHPTGSVVNLGCGLDTRFQRLDEGRLQMIDLDLPEMIAFKRRLIQEGPRYRMIASSVLDFDWMARAELPPDTPHLFLAEGLLMYLPEPSVRDLVLALQANFPGSELVCQVFHSFWVTGWRKAWVNRKLRHSLAFGADATFESGLDHPRAMEAWNPGLRFLDDWSLFDDREPKLGWLRWFGLIPGVRATTTVVHYALDAPPDTVRRTDVGNPI